MVNKFCMVNKCLSIGNALIEMRYTCDCDSLVNSLSANCLTRLDYVVNSRCTIAGREPANTYKTSQMPLKLALVSTPPYAVLSRRWKRAAKKRNKAICTNQVQFHLFTLNFEIKNEQMKLGLTNCFILT